MIASTAFAQLTNNMNQYLYPEYSKTISMDFMGTSLNNVLKIFSQQSGLNFIAASGVSSQPINLYLENVPVEEALERILSANNLTYEIEPGSKIFTVKPLKTPGKDVITRVYPLQHVPVPSSKLNTTLTRSTTGGSSTATGGSSTGIVDAITHLLGDDGSIVEDVRTNSLVITDHPANFAAIEQAIARLDVRIPQVLIEVEMLDISKSTGEQLGAKFQNSKLFELTGASKDTFFPFFENKVLDKADESITYTEGTLDFTSMNLIIEFLRSQTDTKNLAHPKILTLNNETAEIVITTDEAIGISTTENTQSGTTNTSAERAQTGVSLRVTPYASLVTREITMAIEPIVSEARTGGTFSGRTFRDPEERSTRSILRVRDGDTIILGGLVRIDEETTWTKIPFIGEIPFLGAAFRHKNKTTSDRELIIFITPHIVEDNLRNAVALTKNKSFIREQSIPSRRLDQINRDLSYFENRKF